jgi:hypothetical protein
MDHIKKYCEERQTMRTLRQRTLISEDQGLAHEEEAAA